MSVDNFRDKSARKHVVLPVTPPFIWPDSRYHACVADYKETPPSRRFFAEASLISGVIVGASDATVRWLEELCNTEGNPEIKLVLILYPAGPTRVHHLKQILALLPDQHSEKQHIDVRVLPVENLFTSDCEVTVLPPTVIQAHNPKGDRTVMSVGSVGDAGHDPVYLGSLNLVFQPDDATRDAWRRWFQYLLSSSAALTPQTTEIPHLVPARGDPEAARLWDAFRLMCTSDDAVHPATPQVDPETGEVNTDANGAKTVPWDGGQTALDPLAQVLQQVYASGWLVTVDEGTRIKPLSIPVKATLLGQKSEQTVGAVKHKQSFTLQVLNDNVDKAIEKCRKVTDLMELLTYPLSQGNRWMPEAATVLLEDELDSRNEQGQEALWNALGVGNKITPETAKSFLDKELKSGDSKIQEALRAELGNNDLTLEIATNFLQKKLKSGNDKELKKAFRNALVKQFIDKSRKNIRKDLNEMYRQLGQGDAVPEDKLETVLDEVEERLTAALDKRITPRAVFNRISPPDLTGSAPDENWNQPLALLVRSGRVLRKLLTDPYFPRRFSGLSFSEDDFRKACNVFGDAIVTQQDRRRANHELAELDKIVGSNQLAKDRCHDVWRLIRGDRPQPGQSPHDQS